MRTTAFATGLLAATAVACGPADEPLSAPQARQIAAARQASSTSDGFIDRDRSADRAQNAAKIPSQLSLLLDASTDVAKIMSNVSTALEVTIKAFELLGFLQSQSDIEAARFAALHDHLDQLGVALSTQALSIARDNRLSNMRSSVNVVNAFAQRGGGRIDESLLSTSEIVELGNARTLSQTAAQNAGDLSSFQRVHAEYVTDGADPNPALIDYNRDGRADWKDYIADRPALTGGLVFDWRLGIAELIQLIAARLTIIGMTDPNFRSNGERMQELSQYRARLDGYYQEMVNGIRCNADELTPVTVVCADIHTGLTLSGQFVEPKCREQYNAAACNARINVEQAYLIRSLMTRMPLFEMRIAMDALAASMTAAPDLTATRRIRVSGTQNCLTLGLNQYDANGEEIPDRWHIGATTPCGNDPNQEWVHDPASGHIRNAAGACLGQDRFALGSPSQAVSWTGLSAQPCSNSAGERWSYDPWSGVLENGFHGVLSAPPSWISAAPHTELRGASSTQSWNAPPPFCGTATGSQTLLQQVQAIHNADGRMELFFIKAPGHLYHSWQATPNGSWVNEVALGGAAKQLAVARNADGRLEIFYIGPDDGIYHNWQVVPNGHWAGEAPLGGWAKQIAVGQNQDGRLELFVIGTDDAIYHNRQVVPNGAWAGYAPLGGWAKQIAVGQNQDGRLEIISVGTNDAIYHNRQTAPNADWGGEAALGGWAKQIALGQIQDGRLEMIYVGTNNALYHNRQVVSGGQWGGESPFGGFANQLAVGKNVDGRLQVFSMTSSSFARTVQAAANSATWSSPVPLPACAAP